MKAILLALGLAGLDLPPAAAATPLLRVAMVDVEGGAATLFVTPEGKSLLVDTGWPATSTSAPATQTGRPASSADRIVAAARRLGLQKLDYVLITHYHLDHAGGLGDLLARMPVGTVIEHGANREEPPQDAPPPDWHGDVVYRQYLKAVAGQRRMTVKAGDRLRIGGLTLDFVTAHGAVSRKKPSRAATRTPGCEAFVEPTRGGVENDSSIGFVANFGNARILALGDLTAPLEKQLVCPKNRLGRIDLFLVSHHGSALSNSPLLVDAIAPRVAVVGNGARKGGDKAVMATLAAAPSRPAVWQLHAVARSPEADRPDAYVANTALVADTGYGIDAWVRRDGTVGVTNLRNGHSEAYPPADQPHHHQDKQTGL